MVTHIAGISSQLNCYSKMIVQIPRETKHKVAKRETEENIKTWFKSMNYLGKRLVFKSDFCTSSEKAGSCLLLVGSLQYRTLTNCMYWFPLPFQLPVVI